MQFLLTLSINKYNILMIFWNVFLAVVPCLIVYYIALSAKGKKWSSLRYGERVSFILIVLLWLFMFPNTAYLFFIVRHLANYCMHYDKYRVCQEGNTWIVMFFFTYSAIGIPTFYYALNKMSDVLKKLFSQKTAIILPVIVIPLTAIGVMFGLFERFNSWDILLNPLAILNTVFGYFTDLNLLSNFLIFTICMYLIYYGCGYFIWKIVKK